MTILGKVAKLVNDLKTTGVLDTHTQVRFSYDSDKEAKLTFLNDFAFSQSDTKTIEIACKERFESCRLLSSEVIILCKIFEF